MTAFEIASEEVIETAFATTSRLYAENCAVCHGDQLQGAAQGRALIGGELVHGASPEALVASIGEGFPERGMPGWKQTLDPGQIRSLAALIAERRLGYEYSAVGYRFAEPLTLPEGIIRTRHHAFRLESVAVDLDPYPFAIVPLPDGRILLSERMSGLRFISAQGEKLPRISGTPPTYGFTQRPLGVPMGIGWSLGVALHPEYKDNGWIYLHHTDRCEDCNDKSRRLGVPVSLNRVIRGRIREGKWVDEEVIWSGQRDHYTELPDASIGGGLAFDDAGHVYFSTGMKESAAEGIQDLSKPYGKIHRLHDDGRIPADNPFVGRSHAIHSIWNLGHRNPISLAFDPGRGKLWSTDMGPRGGDELNLLLPGHNYGWPVHTLGTEYDGTPIDYDVEVEVGLEDIDWPFVEFTPSPALSSVTFYRGDAFPAWQDQMLVGSLKGMTLFRVVVDEDGLVERESLITNLARIRDVAVDRDGHILLLLEHESGGRIMRLVPEPILGAREAAGT